MDRKNDIAKTIKQLRKAYGMTQKELADATGISLPAIIAYENRKREPNSKNMAVLEHFFHVSGAYLRGESGDKTEIVLSDDPIAEVSASMKQIQTYIHRESEENRMVYQQILETLALVGTMEDRVMRSLLLKLLARVMKEMLDGVMENCPKV